VSKALVSNINIGLKVPSVRGLAASFNNHILRVSKTYIALSARGLATLFNDYVLRVSKVGIALDIVSMGKITMSISTFTRDISV
jgi:DNA-binding transcriptional regulator YhcF (GntR family)